MSGHLVLIASYPKSGNTWVRLVLQSLQRGAPVSINAIDIGFYGHQRRRYFDGLAPADAAELSPDEIENLLPDIYATLASESDGPVFVKTHDRARRTSQGRWLFPPEHVKAVLHLARHPFDVAVSYAHHRGVPVAEAAALLCDEGHTIAEARQSLPLPLFERPGSWATHASSWLDAAPYPVLVTRYEDLCADPHGEFARLACAAGLGARDTALADAVQAASLEQLQAQEHLHGFRERPYPDRPFFRQGGSQTWNETLSEAARARIVSTQSCAMARLGYRSDGTVAPGLDGESRANYRPG